MPDEASADHSRKIFLIATEESGDRLGSSLMKALRRRLGDTVRFEGVGGQSMAREGLVSLFPIEGLWIMGIAAVVKQLPMILRRNSRDQRMPFSAAAPDMLVIIDSPDFTHRVARRVRARRRVLPIVDYVSPSVWAWRPGRARAMRSYVDHDWRCCRSNRKRIAGSKVRPAPMSAIPLTRAGECCGRTPRNVSGAMRQLRRFWYCPGAGVAKSAITSPPSARPRGVATERPQMDVILPTMPHLVDEIP